MNDSAFEAELRALIPAMPALALEKQVAWELSRPATETILKETASGKRQPMSIRFEQAPEPLLVRCFHSLGWALAGAASAVAVIALYPVKPAVEKSGSHSVTLPAGSSRAVSNEAPKLARSVTESSDPANVRSASIPSIQSISSIPEAADASEVTSLETTRELVSTQEESQIEYRSDNTPMHRVRYLYRERHSWINPRTGARTEIEIPREDVFLKPVSVQ